MQYKFVLEPYNGMKTRYNCPICQNKNKTFSRYINTETGEYLSTKVGRCSRENSCGYHYTPKQHFQDNNVKSNYILDNKNLKRMKTVVKPTTFIPINILKGSLTNYEENNFIQFLINLFGTKITNDLISKYFIGTSCYWKGSTVFWQIDESGNTRTGKIMLYDPINCKRIKEPFNHIQWIHTTINQPEFHLKQCLFGEHLLKYDNKTVAIVESEKTAIIASVYIPQYVWIAAGSLNNLSIERCSILKGRNVILFPDLNGFNKWSIKALEINKIANVHVSDIIERIATEEERIKSLDLVDYLIKNRDKSGFALHEFGYPIFWDY
jgi:hypothetical protein